MMQKEWTHFLPLFFLGLLACVLYQCIQNSCKVVASDPNKGVTNQHLTNGILP